MLKKLNFENLPEAVEMMAEQLNRIEVSLNEKTPPTNTSNKKYNVKEAAAYCRVAESTFRTFIYKRRVAGSKPSRAWIFLEKDLDKFISDHRRPTVKELKAEAFNQLNGKGGRS